VVLDEYGGMFGIVTMNDLLEQLVGELKDTEDTEDEVPMIQKTGEDTWDVQGICPLGDVAEELEIELPTEKYDTFGGYVFANYGLVPDDGTEFEVEIERLHVRVTEIREHRIEAMTVTLMPLPEDEEDEEDDEDREDSKEKNRKKKKADEDDK